MTLESGQFVTNFLDFFFKYLNSIFHADNVSGGRGANNSITEAQSSLTAAIFPAWLIAVVSPQRDKRRLFAHYWRGLIELGRECKGTALIVWLKLNAVSSASCSGVAIARTG
jgi:hypothetical protein